MRINFLGQFVHKQMYIRFVSTSYMLQFSHVPGTFLVDGRLPSLPYFHSGDVGSKWAVSQMDYWRNVQYAIITRYIIATVYQRCCVLLSNQFFVSTLATLQDVFIYLHELTLSDMERFFDMIERFYKSQTVSRITKRFLV